MRNHWRTPITRVCENCNKEFTFNSGRLRRKYCDKKCAGEGFKKRRIELSLIPRESERIMWLKYWYYRFKGLKVEGITDLNDANDFSYCSRELNEMTYKNNKSKSEYNKITS